MNMLLPATILLFTITAVMLLLTTYTLPLRHTPTVLPFSLLTIGIALWTFGYSFELLSQAFAVKLFWAKLQISVVALMPIIWMVFGLSYINSRFVTRRTIALLCIIPTITILVIWTNDLHHLHWTTVTAPQRGTFPALIVTRGPYFFVHAIYSYVALLIGTSALFRSPRPALRRYRYQTIAMIIGGITPFIGNVIYIAGFSPIPQLDLTPFAFAVSAFVFTWSIFGFQMFHIGPIAYKLIVDGMHDPVIVLDAHGRIATTNTSATSILGQEGTLLVGHYITNVLPWWGQIVQQEHSEIALEYEGDQRHFDIRLTPLLRQGGRLRGHVAVFHDVTDRKRTETALRAMYDAQSDLIAQIAHAKQDAEDANVAKTEFISFVSHELKTPMAAIRGYTDLMSMGFAGQLTPTVEEYISNIRSNIDSLVMLVTDLSDAARIETDQFELDFNYVNLDEVVSQVLRSTDSIINNYQHTVVHDLPQDLPFIWGDRRRIIQIMTNLLSNACKYTPSGGLIQISAARDELSDQFIRISVSDNGYGIEPDQQLMLFNKFFRAKGAKQRGINGTGLGLHITRHLVEHHGGKIWFESEVGVGTTFYFTMPTVAEPQLSIHTPNVSSTF